MSGLSKLPERGDIWKINLSPVSGREQDGYRPCIIASTDAFINKQALLLRVGVHSPNQNEGLVVFVFPITSPEKGMFQERQGLTIPLDEEYGLEKISGKVLINQGRNIDIINRSCRFVEKAPKLLIDRCVMKHAGLIYKK